ncbi:MAG: RES family NAD+ phosphorylase [Chloroflexi bacterium]|nr:RES family NAD+ phosphorylase [Chloroflexota bacterium]
MPKLPRPPSARELAAIPPDWKVVPDGTLLFRVYFQGGAYPAPWYGFRSYGPADTRFDHHEPPPHVQGRGILYAATAPRTCLAEVFQTRRSINTYKSAPWLVGFRLARRVRLLDLTGLWSTRAGGSMAINSGPRPRAREWSRALYEGYPDAEGLWYGSSMCGNAPALALYERAQGALPGVPVFHRALAEPALLGMLEACARELGYALVVRPLATVTRTTG